MPTFRPITLTIPHPATLLSMFKPLHFNSQWNYNQNTQNKPSTSYGPPPPPKTTTTQAPYVHQHHGTHLFNKQFNWDLNWNFNHGSSSSLGAATNQKEEAPVLTTTTTTEKITTVGNSQNSNGLHGEKRINVQWSLDFNHNNNNNKGSSSGGGESSGNAAPSINLQPPNKASADFNGDDADNDDEKNDANDESDR
jgi:hypothetical protein